MKQATANTSPTSTMPLRLHIPPPRPSEVRTGRPSHGSLILASLRKKTRQAPRCWCATALSKSSLMIAGSSTALPYPSLSRPEQSPLKVLAGSVGRSSNSSPSSIARRNTQASNPRASSRSSSRKSALLKNAYDRNGRNSIRPHVSHFHSICDPRKSRWNSYT